MKKLLVLSLGILFVLVLVSCEKITTANTTTHNGSSSTTQPTSPATTKFDSTTTETAVVQSTTTTTTTAPVVSKKSVEITYLSNTSNYGNTNGNANNKGFVVYDRTNKLHYYALGPNVYRFNPATLQTTLLFTLSSGAGVLHLCLSATDLYFVSTENFWMMKYNFASQTITSIYEREMRYVSRYGNYIFGSMTKLDYGGEPITGFGIYRHDNQSFLTNFSNGATTMNISGTKLLYTTNNGPVIELMADNFMGKSTLKSFADQNFTEIKELVLIQEGSSSPYSCVFGLIATTSLETTLYLYRTETDTLTTIDTGSGIHSINTNGTDLYYLKNGELYRCAIETGAAEKVLNLYTDSKYLCIINHWLYFSNNALSTLYRINPDTLDIENLSH